MESQLAIVIIAFGLGESWLEGGRGGMYSELWMDG